ncbi:hypothetical protein COCC4DRAFT_29272 [Bipolaris maydis ATCC 48331]|uniref:Uncharacterized protein n=2 Tax=Cochliobolus heterostrophus TaxID=5016 RepID=M2V743_COCH5|nr:uncharacterized protein COCC4DRAFT_29272 [Bipolaris maydis ATCC 48331]EMD95563.1 hypothetical protein COCHEDRAFT_1019283 [Bipolaris maydis C5]ENI10425.1 hypothetical protein COCC4DRAFT_29272 [Bipolaris maydis ATCC 48331]
MVWVEVQRLCLQSGARKLNARLHGDAIVCVCGSRMPREINYDFFFSMSQST